MAPGPQTRTLTQDQIARLDKFRRARHEGAPSGYSLPQLRSAMGMPFGFRTLGKALQGRPVLDLHHSRIVEWIERYLGQGKAPKSVIDGKAAASGERDEENGTEANRTARGSR